MDKLTEFNMQKQTYMAKILRLQAEIATLTKERDEARKGREDFRLARIVEEQHQQLVELERKWFDKLKENECLESENAALRKQVEELQEEKCTIAYKWGETKGEKYLLEQQLSRMREVLVYLLAVAHHTIEEEKWRIKQALSETEEGK